MLELATHERTRPAGDVARADAGPSAEMLTSLLSISKSTRAYYGLKLAALGFHNGQDELLIAIGDQAMPVSMMADQLSVRPSTVSKMLDRLIEKGLCERIADRRDARRSLVHITPAGINCREQLLELRREVEGDLVRHMDPEACSTMKQNLRQCSDHLNRQLRRVR